MINRHIPQTKIFGGKRYQLYGSKGTMNKGKAKTAAAQLKLEGKLARVVPLCLIGRLNLGSLSEMVRKQGKEVL